MPILYKKTIKGPTDPPGKKKTKKSKGNKTMSLSGKSYSITPNPNRPYSTEESNLRDSNKFPIKVSKSSMDQMKAMKIKDDAEKEKLEKEKEAKKLEMQKNIPNKRKGIFKRKKSPIKGQNNIKMSEKKEQAWDKVLIRYMTTQVEGGIGTEELAEIRKTFEEEYDIYNKIKPEKTVRMNSEDIIDYNKEDGNAFDYKNKFWHPSSAAMSRYKAFKDVGDEDGANNVLLGFFDASKRGSGPYSEATHGAGTTSGTTKPIRFKDLMNVLKWDAEPAIKNFNSYLKEVGFMKLGGILDTRYKRK